MTLMYPWVLLIGALIVAALIAATWVLFSKRSEERYSTGSRVANADQMKELPSFKKAVFNRKRDVVVLVAIVSVLSLVSFAILARPISHESYDNYPARKDIMLCLDISGSLSNQNEEIIKAMREVIKGLNGERVGITIFNVSSLVDVPLTDDYEYISDRLDDLEEYIAFENSYFSMDGSIDVFALLSQTDPKWSNISYYDTAVAFTNDGLDRGSSLVGEGLATALYSFPHLEDDDRARVIVLSTDNEEIKGEDKEPIISLQEAAKECSRNDVEIIALFPTPQPEEVRKWMGLDPFDPQDEVDLRQAVASTGGETYTITDKNASADIVNAINSIEHTYVGNQSTVDIDYDDPSVLFTVLVILLSGAAIWRVWRNA